MEKLKLDLTELKVESFETKNQNLSKGTVAGNTGPFCDITGINDCPSQYETCDPCDTIQTCGDSCQGNCGSGTTTAVSHQPPCC